VSYESFLASKRIVAPPAGLNGDFDLSPRLMPWQAAVTKWALRRCRSALFEDCGLGKTIQSLEWGRVIAEHADAPVLLLAPLAVSLQTVAEAEKFGIRNVRRISGRDDVGPGVNVINYDRLHKIDPAAFGGVILDESSILKSYDGATRNAIIQAFSATPFRLACTATPAPNDYMELGNHAEFLGIMDRVEMLATFFNHDGGDTSKWRLKKHGEIDFWRWLASWSVYIRRPSDIGFSDEGYDLPALRRHEIMIETGAAPGYLFPVEVRGLHERRAVRRQSLSERVARCAALANASSEPWIVWCELNDESAALAAEIRGAVEVKGADTTEQKEAALFGFLRGEHRVLVSKPSICGHGLNFQHCCKMVFVGLSDSFEALYQATRREWRFGQTQPVDVYFILTDQEGPVLRNVRAKEERARLMADSVAEHMSVFETAAVHEAARRESMDYVTEERTGDGWTMHLGDAVEVARTIAVDSVGLSIFSPPFASLYTYSANERDMGNVRSDDEFMEHFRFLVAELYRVTMPGRHVCFHCMNLPLQKWKDGVIGLRDFRGELIRIFADAGFIHHSEVVIWKDPVVEMQRTKALGLLHKQVKKDSTRSRMGLPDYLVTMRKPGDNPEPVGHEAADFPVARWQRWASPVWMDIDQGNTLQYRAAREANDERHICPLQLGVIERAIDLWSNPGDLVLDPFAGIGSTGYQAIKQGRLFAGIELKGSYFEQACKNLRAAEAERPQASLFCAETACAS